MNYSRLLTSAAVFATLSLLVPPAFAGQRGGGRSRGSNSSRGSGGAAPRSASPAVRSAPSRSYSAPASRGGYAGQPVYSSQSRGVYPAPRGTAYARVAPRYYPSRGINVAPRRFYSPYYSFRPRFSLGFGLWVGYPVTYSYPYYYGYPYYGGYSYYGSPYYGSAYYGDPYYDVYPYGSAGSSYGQYYPPSIREYSAGPSSTYPPANYPPASAPQSGSYGPDPGTGSIVAPPGASSGGVSFEISPSTAEVYIDGKYAGRVSDLGPTTQPMALTTGRHHVEIRATGYQTMSFDADVSTGQVIPYQGTMQRER